MQASERPITRGVRWSWVVAGLATPLAVAVSVVVLAIHADISERLAVWMLWLSLIGLILMASGVARGLPQTWTGFGRWSVALVLAAPPFAVATVVGFLPLVLLMAMWMP